MVRPLDISDSEMSDMEVARTPPPRMNRLDSQRKSHRDSQHLHSQDSHGADNSQDSSRTMDLETVPDSQTIRTTEGNTESGLSNEDQTTPDQDASDPTNLPKAFDFLQSHPANKDESEQEYLDRIRNELKKVTDKTSRTQDAVMKGIRMGDLPQPRNKKQGMDPTWAPAIEQLVQNVRNSARVSLLLDLNSCSVDILLNYAMRDLDWSEELKSYAYYTIRKRMKSNLSSWKHRALKSLTDYIKRLVDEDEDGDFAAETELTRLQRYLEKRFSVDNFVQIFDWVRPVIDLHSSSEKLRTWCTILFAELGAYAKRNLDWERDPSSPQQDPFNKANYLNRFDVLAEIPQLQQFKPTRSDVKIIHTVKASTPAKRKTKDGITDHMNDPMVFIPQVKKNKK